MVRAALAVALRSLAQLSNGFALLVVVLATWVSCACALHRPHIGDFMDDGEYFVAAQSIRDGKGYRLPSRPGSPPELKYPPGLSLIAAQLLPVNRATVESDFHAARLVAILATLVYAITSFVTLRLLGVSGIIAAGCLVPAMFSDTYLTESLSLLSDIPFAACCTCAALVWALVRRGAIRSTGWVAVTLGLLAGASLSLRSNGVALCCACLALVMQTRNRLRSSALYLFAAALLPVTARLITRAAVSVAPSEPYSVNWVAYSSAKAGTAIVLGNFATYINAVPVLFVPELTTNLFSRLPLLSITIKILVWLTILRGIQLARRDVRRVDAAPILFAVLTFAICLVWPWPLYLRVMVPFMPFLVALALAGVRPPFGWRFPFAKVGLVGLVAATAAQLIMTARALRNPSSGLDEAFKFIRSSTEADAVLVTQFPETTFLYTGRQAVKLLNDQDMISRRFGNWAAIDAWAPVAAGRPFYLLGPPAAQHTSEPLAQQVAALALSDPNRLAELYRTGVGDLAVFKIAARK
jgi:hypothetical protein